MECPKCDAEMEDVEIYEAIIKRCTSCKGLWFDRSKHEFLKGKEDSGEIDTGDPEMGKIFNKKEDILCPDCSAPMIKMVVNEQPHIHYESCSKCFSAFFDAGEFKDYVEKDIFDFFKDLMAKER
jgi:uncharacterized protein